MPETAYLFIALLIGAAVVFLAMQPLLKSRYEAGKSENSQEMATLKERNKGMEESIADLKETVKNNKETQAKQQEVENGYRAEKASMSEKLRQMDVLEKEKQVLVSDKTAMNLTIKELSEELATIREKLEHTTRIEDELKKLMCKQENEQKLFVEVNRENTKLTTSLDEKNASLEEKMLRIGELSKELNNSRDEYKKLQENYNASIEKLATAEEKNEQLEIIEIERSAAKLEITKLSGTVKEQAEELATIREKLEHTVRIESELKQLSEKHEVQQQQVIEMNRENTKLLTSLEESVKSTEEKILRIGELSKELTESRTKYQTLQDSFTNITEKLAIAEEKNEQLDKSLAKITEKEAEISQLIKDKTILAADLRELETRISEERKQGEERLKLLEESRETLKLEFKELAAKILEEKSLRFTQSNKENIDGVLKPLKEQIKEFALKIDNVYGKEAKERHSLRQEIINLQELNVKMSDDALNLTKALKGDSQKRGAWGELILERVLEASGLTKGREYLTQDTYHDEEGKRLRPDVIVRLPDEKDVIIDSKLSLNAYERYSSADSENERIKATKDHLLSVKNHIKELSKKNYQELKEVNSLDYVILFMPVEGAFRLALETDPELFLSSYKENVMLASPSTLLIILRTIQKIWQFEYQNQNTQKIADHAGKLHTKFCNFVEELEKIGKHLHNGVSAWENSKKALSTGRGNLITQVQKLEAMGVPSKKTLPKHLVDSALLAEETIMIDQKDSAESNLLT